MKSGLILLFLTGLALANAYYRDYDDYNDYEPYRRPMRRPSYRLRLRARRPMYFSTAGSNKPMDANSPMARSLSFGGRGRYKTSHQGAADANILGQKGGFKGQYAGDGQAEGGVKMDSEEWSTGVRGQNRGSGQGAAMGDTIFGGGSGKWSGAHDVGGETGASWDSEDGDGGSGGDKGYMGNWND